MVHLISDTAFFGRGKLHNEYYVVFILFEKDFAALKCESIFPIE